MMTKKIAPNATILYLDQNIWIYLARQHYGVDNISARARILEKARDLIDQNKLIIPINLTNVNETLKRRDQESRARLAKFMVETSKAFTFQPYVLLLDAEIENLILSTLKRPQKNIRELAIGKGASFLVGGRPKVSLGKLEQEIGKNLLEEIHKKAQEHFDSPEFLLEIMRTPDESQGELFRELDQMHQNFEEKRRELFEIQDKTQRKRREVTFHLINSVTPRLVELCNKYQINPQQIVPIGINEEQIMELFRQLPINYTSFCLYYGRDIERFRQIARNDFYDIASLSFAIPYCDIVVAERFFISIARTANLDREYGTILLSSLEDLECYLNSIQ